MVKVDVIEGVRTTNSSSTMICEESQPDSIAELTRAIVPLIQKLAA